MNTQYQTSIEKLPAHVSQKLVEKGMNFIQSLGLEPEKGIPVLMICNPDETAIFFNPDGEPAHVELLVIKVEF